MNKKLKLALIAVTMTMAGCAGLNQPDRLEQEALRDYQKAEALVVRKNIKLELAIKAADKASEGVVEAREELKAAEEAMVLAKKKLDDTLAK